MFRAKKIKKIKKTAILNRKHKRVKIYDNEEKEKNSVVSKSSTNDSSKNSVKI